MTYLNEFFYIFVVKYAKLIKKSIPILENCSLVSEKEFPHATVRIYSNGIFHAYFYSKGILDMNLIHEIDLFNEENRGHAYRNLFEFEPLVEIDPEVRKWASAPDGNKKTIADAILINSLAHKLQANFYLKFNKPVKPTKLFNAREKAVVWLLKQK